MDHIAKSNLNVKFKPDPKIDDQLNQTKNTQNKVDSWTLMSLDDVGRLFVIDQILDFDTRKFYKSSQLSANIKTLRNELFKDPVTNERTIELKNCLIKIIRTHKLYLEWNVQRMANVDRILFSYLKCIATESSTVIHECNRYEGDNFKGVMVKAKVDIAKNACLKHLFGYCAKVDDEAKLHLETQKLDYSLMRSNKSKTDFIMLGPASLLNHDCNANCQYYSFSKTTVIIQTLRKINTGEELLCYYGSDYFGLKNIECACVTCEGMKEGSFTQSKKDTLSLEVEKAQQCNDHDTLLGSGNSSVVSNSALIISDDLKQGSLKIKEIEQPDDSSYVTCKDVYEQLEDFHEAFHGFGCYKKLDNKLNHAIVKLERIDISKCVSKKKNCTNTDNQTVSISESTKEDILYKTKNGYGFCIYCEQFKTQLPRHLRLVHEDKGIVNSCLFSSDAKLRNSATSFVRNQGFGHLQNETGVMIPAKSVKKDAVSEVIKSQCDNCFGYFSKKTLPSHRKSCFLITVDKVRSLMPKR